VFEAQNQIAALVIVKQSHPGMIEIRRPPLTGGAQDIFTDGEFERPAAADALRRADKCQRGPAIAAKLPALADYGIALQTLPRQYRIERKPQQRCDCPPLPASCILPLIDHDWNGL
jgi:hypothetical protein